MTSNMLERVPENSFTWKPLEKSRTLHELATHSANLPGIFITGLQNDEFDHREYTAVTDSPAQISETFDWNVAAAIEVLKMLSDERRPAELAAPEIAGMLVSGAGAAAALWCMVTFAILGKGTPAL